MKTNKLKITSLKIESFVTSLNGIDKNTIAGGQAAPLGQGQTVPAPGDFKSYAGTCWYCPTMGGPSCFATCNPVGTICP